MYLSTEDARSDFFLAAAVYIIGPLLLSLLLRSTGTLLSGVGARWALAILVPVLLVAAMPLYLMRYRGEPWGTLVRGSTDAVWLGAAAGAAVVVGTLLGDVVAGNGVADALSGTFQDPIILTGRVLRWLSLAVLAVFLYRRAEYAFRPISERWTTLVTRAAIGTVGAAVIASLLLLVRGLPFALVLAPLGFAGAFLVARTLFHPQGMVEQWMLYAPLITLALGPLDIFSLLFDPLEFLVGLRTAGMVAGFGLVAIMGLGAGKGGRLAFVLALVIALLSSVSVFGSTL